ncbi:hypothetical protein [Terrisporobacter petrolearius]|uniref:hypothetical protein n=1 Tax=Terrisporobacter petrolearius TaxID=1460447 RepID=UPI0031CCB2B6
MFLALADLLSSGLVVIVVIFNKLFGGLKSMYTLISMYLTSISIEKAKDIFNKQKLILLIS